MFASGLNNAPSEEDDIGGERDDIVEAISAAGGVLAGQPDDEGSDSDEEPGEGTGGGGSFETIEPVREVSPVASNLAWVGYTSMLKLVEMSTLDSEYPAPGFSDSVKGCSQTKEYFDECCAKFMPTFMAKAGPAEGLIIMTGMHYASAAAAEKEKTRGIKGREPEVGEKRPREESQEVFVPPAKKPQSNIPIIQTGIMDPIVY